MNDSFPTTVSGVARDHFQLWFRQPVEAQDASGVPSRERPKDPCGSVQHGMESLSGTSSGTAIPAFELRPDEELDEPIGTAAAYAVRNVPVARPEERVGAVLDGMRGSTFDSAIVVARVYERAPRRSRPNRAAPGGAGGRRTRPRRALRRVGECPFSKAHLAANAEFGLSAGLPARQAW
jgi:hypothetical protein